jgi:hypothetical protein
MYITENWSWQAHICSLCHSLSKTYYIIKFLTTILSNCMLWNIYFAYIQSRLRYGTILWGGTGDSIKVLRIIRKVMRVIKGIKKYKSCRQKFKENRILTVTSIYVFEVLCFVKKYKGNLKQNCMFHEHNTTSKYDLHTQFCNTTSFQKSVLTLLVLALHTVRTREVRAWFCENC